MQNLIIVLINLLFFGRTIFWGYVSDDLIARKGKEITTHNIFIILKSIYKSQPLQPKFDHSINLIIHTLNCLLIYWVFGGDNVSFLAAVLFAINPVNTQGGSVWLSGRPYVLAATFTLLMFNFPLIAPLFYYFAYFFSFSAILAPLVFINTKWWFWVFLIPLSFILSRKRINSTLKSKSDSVSPFMKSFSFIKIILVFKTFGYYTQLALFPFRLALYHPFLYSFGVSKGDIEECLRIDWPFWKGVLISALVGYLIITNWGNPLGFGLTWWCANIAIWLNYCTIQQSISERYMLLPNCGLMCALSWVILKIWKN